MRPMSRIPDDLRARRLRSCLLALCDWPSRDELAAHLAIAPRSLGPYLRALAGAGARIARQGDRYGLAMGPADVAGLMDRVSAIGTLRTPKTQATSQACDKSTGPQK